MKKLQVVLSKTTFLACLLAVMAGGCSKDKSSTKSGGEDGGVAGESGAGGNAGSGGDSGGESSSGGTTGGKSSAGGTSSATSSTAPASDTGGTAGSAGTGGTTSGITALSVKAEQSSLRGLVEQTLTLGVTIEREGSSNGDVTVAVQGLPAGVGSTPVKIATGSNEAQLQVKIGATAQVGGPYAFSVVATSVDDSSVSTSTPMVLYIAQKAGALDMSFGNAGAAQITTALSSGGTVLTAYLQAIAVDSKGRVAVGGFTSNLTVSTGWVVRLTSNGTLDTTFANTGTLNNFGLPASWVYDVVFSNDQLYVSAEQSSHDLTAYIRKITETGTTDSTFNSGLDVTTQSNWALLAAFQGGVVVSDDPIALIRANGSVDMSFTATKGLGGAHLVVDSQDRFLYARTPTSSTFGIGRLSSTGEADSSFGTNGEATYACPTGGNRSYAVGGRVLPTPNQSVMVLVECRQVPRSVFDVQAALVAFSPTGQPVRGFGENGRLIVTDPGGGSGAVVQPDGKVVVLYSQNSEATDGYVYDYVLSRYDSTGAKDTTFGESGIVKVGSSHSNDVLPVMAYDASAQRVVVALPVVGSTNIEMKRVWL